MKKSIFSQESEQLKISYAVGDEKQGPTEMQAKSPKDRGYAYCISPHGPPKNTLFWALNLGLAGGQPGLQGVKLFGRARPRTQFPCIFQELLGSMGKPHFFFFFP